MGEPILPVSGAKFPDLAYVAGQTRSAPFDLDDLAHNLAEARGQVEEAAMNKPTRPEVTGRRAGLSGGGQPPMTGFVDDRRYVDMKTFCRIFAIPRTRVYNLVNSGKLTRRKLGGRNWFIVAEGEAYMRSLDEAVEEVGRNRR